MAERFDHAAANNEANSNALEVLKSTTPTAFKLSRQIIMHSHSVSLRPGVPRLYLDAGVGVWSCRCAQASARAFADYMLDPAHRDESGFLRVPGSSGRSQGGYFDYDSLTVPLNSQLQSIRTLSASSELEAHDLVRSIPGLLSLLQDVLQRLGCSDPTAWGKYLKAFHGLILSVDRQVEFTWHEDIFETPWLKQRCLTAVVQCSDAVTAMRMFGFQPFVYDGEGHTSVFPGHAIHQAYPLTQEALSALSKPVVKAVFFLEPEPDGDQPCAEALPRAPPPSNTAKRSKRT